jgi:hypothetical protein
LFPIRQPQLTVPAVDPVAEFQRDRREEIDDHATTVLIFKPGK